MKFLKQIKSGRKLNTLILSVLFIMTSLYSFILAYKRYLNFEHGKFDLGNMAQMVWNTSHGHFMEVTDQFGTNMPRWGMSHIDPIVAIFAPIYLLIPDPMLLVVVQQLLIISAIYPLFVLAKWKSRSVLTAFLVVLVYILYPANGFTLVWTGFHGVSFVAPILLWLVWFLERNNFLINANLSKKIIYWAAIILMLMGKEEIGAILALASVFLFFKNKRLAVSTAIISIVWTLLCFLVFIPAYSHYRTESVDTFFDKVGITNSESVFIGGDNFFLNRYSYLGDSYGEIAVNTITKPQLVYKKTFTPDKLAALNNLFGPMGYIVVFSPLWLISAPDLAVVLLSQDEIFDISNHRIAFIIISIFLALVYMFGYIRNFVNKKFPNFKHLNLVFSVFMVVLLASNLYFSAATNNPLFVSGKSFIESKIITKVFAKEYAVGETKNSRVPRNDNECLQYMSDMIIKNNPEIYTGPDYLGAQSANRRVNALFPSRFWDSNLVMADVFEAKTLGVFGDSGWIFNKEGYRRMLAMNRYKHVYSCGKLSAFVEGENKDKAEFVNESDYSQYQTYKVSTKKIEMDLRVVELPQNFDNKNPQPFVTVASRLSGTFKDKVTFWIFEDDSNSEKKLMFVDYLSIASNESLDKAEERQNVKETYFPKLDTLHFGKYKVFWGVGDLLDASQVYVGTINVAN